MTVKKHMKRQQLKTPALALLMSSALIPSASAAVLAGWDNDPAVHGSETWVSNYSATGINSSTIVTGAGISAKTTSGGPSAAAAMKYTGNTQTTVADSLANDAYLSFTITSEAGQAFDITSVQVADINFNSPSTMQWELRTSVDSFATAFGSTDISSNASDGIELFSPVSVTGQTSVEFRLYSWWTIGGGGSTNIHLRNDKTAIGDFPDATGLLSDPIVVVNGNVSAVPEPNSVVLLSIAGISLVMRRRK
jgi:hypothetical protein